MHFQGQNSPEELFPPIQLVESEINYPEPTFPQDIQLQTSISHQTLHESKKKMTKFVQSLHKFRKTELRPDVLSHCAQLNKSRKVIHNYISDETVVRMVSSRIDKMVKNRKIKKNWSQQDLKILVWTVSKYCDLNSISDLQKDLTHDDWNQISELIPGVNPSCCMFKWLSIKKTNLSVKHWMQMQANMLRDIVEEHLRYPNMHPNILNWKVISQKLYKNNPLPNKIFRSAKQCREHWNCYLNPHLKKGPWELSQDIQLLQLIRGNNGEKKWSQIVYSFEGRTQNALKNRFTLLIDKQKKFSKSKQEKSLIQDCLTRCTQEYVSRNGECKSKFINHVLNEDRNQPGENSISFSSEGQEELQDNRGDTVSQTSPQSPQSPMTIKFCKADSFDFLRQIALSRQVRPGCVQNNIFQPHQ